MSTATRVAAGLVAALGPDAVVRHRHNHTGADKLSFTIQVGDRDLWAKVAADDGEEHRLATWARVADLLAERHSAPPLLEVLSVEGRTTLLFAYVDAPAADRAGLHERYAEAHEVLAGLHADAGLAARLGGPTTTAACFRGVWIERFVEDLDIVEGYLAKDLHAYLADEVDALAEQVDALDRRVHAAVHGDPWHENFLVAPDRLWLLDWEDLAVGDPVVDDAILINDALGSHPRHWPDEPAYAVARRALMLDAALDMAADWVENTDPVVRGRKESAYLAGVEAYRASF